MNNQTSAALIIGMCGVILLIGLMRTKVEWLLNIVMRSILGTVIMYFANSALAASGISLGVGINAVTVLTSGILGFPGLVALYALGIYKIL
ncbi:MAG: pro-sigmaK processing inhibitor BofA family protein [Lachnospiraceae bacterium]|nr:pro-sigmaK processing inhibitor BofA family protein [Lachnospiraceae bacterium]